MLLLADHILTDPTRFLDTLASCTVVKVHSSTLSVDASCTNILTISLSFLIFMFFATLRHPRMINRRWSFFVCLFKKIWFGERLTNASAQNSLTWHDSCVLHSLNKPPISAFTPSACRLRIKVRRFIRKIKDNKDNSRMHFLMCYMWKI